MKPVNVPCVVFELANSHGGSQDVVRALIEQFGRVQYPAKAIKLQVFGADTIALPDFAWFSVYRELEFSAEVWSSLIESACKHGDVWIDVFDRLSTRVIRENLQRIAGLKLQASVLENEEVLVELRTLSLEDKTIAINVSGFGLDEVRRLVSVFEAMTRRLVLQIGFQSYPTALEDTALQKVAVLRAAFPDCAIGMADHADPQADFAHLAPLYAHLLGCTYIEKHFCLERAKAKYDAASALEPEEMKQLCGRLVDLARSKSGPFISASERTYLEKSVQVPVLRAQVAEGERVQLGQVLFRRTSQLGMSWAEIDRLQQARHVLAHPRAAHETLRSQDFRPARVAAIVACRMKSSRLPKKALLPLGGVPAVERCLAQCFAIRGVDDVVLATSVLEEDAVLGQYLCGGRAKFWAGDPDDVIARYVGACDRYGVDVIVRVTADCPLVSTEILEYLLERHFESGADYTAASNVSVGTAGEVINASALRTVIACLGRAEHSEYMTWYFRNNPEIFKLRIVDLPPDMVRGYRLTLDHQEDLDLFQELFQRMDASKTHFSLSEVFGLLDASPELSARNSHVELKYVADKKLIAMLNEKTKIPLDGSELRRRAARSAGGGVPALAGPV